MSSIILEDFDESGRPHSAAGQSLSGRPPLSNIKRPSSTPPGSPARSPKVPMTKRPPYSKTPSPKPCNPQVNVEHPRFSGVGEDLVPKMLKTGGRRTSVEGASKKKGGKKRGKGKKLRMSRQKSQDEKHKNFCFESNPEMCKRNSPRRRRKKKGGEEKAWQEETLLV